MKQRIVRVGRGIDAIADRESSRVGVVGAAVRSVAAALAAAAAVALAAAPTVVAAGPSVAIEGFAYQPAEITVSVGASIAWTNHDAASHSATGKGGTFTTGLLALGQSRTVVFDTAGTFPYVCSVHPEMAGTVVVESPVIPSTDTVPAPGGRTDSIDWRFVAVALASGIGFAVGWRRWLRSAPIAVSSVEADPGVAGQETEGLR